MISIRGSRVLGSGQEMKRRKWTSKLIYLCPNCHGRGRGFEPRRPEGYCRCKAIHLRLALHQISLQSGTRVRKGHQNVSFCAPPLVSLKSKQRLWNEWRDTRPVLAGAQDAPWMPRRGPPCGYSLAT